jgi:uncharacterized membrane protein
MDLLFNQAFVIRQTMDLKNEAVLNITTSFADIVLQHNYRVTTHTDSIVKFECFGPEPVSRHQASYYIDEGKLELIAQADSLLLKLTYSINYVMEAVIIAIPTIIGVFENQSALLVSLLLILYGYYRYRIITKSAKNMLLTAWKGI